MLSSVSKFLLAVAVATAGAGLMYQWVVHERAGSTLLFFVAVAALVACVATAGGTVPNAAPPVPPGAPPPERRATTTGAPPQGSAWPAFAALTVTVLACTAAAGGLVVWVGVIAVVIAGLGWFGTVWRGHTTWTPKVQERVRFRLLVPVALPAAMVLLAATIAISVSRILLAVSKDASVVIALGVAVSILGACWFVASKPRMNSSSVLALVVLAVLAVAGAGISGVAAGEREFHPHEGHGQEVHITAHEIKFSTDSITVHAGGEVFMEFDNEDEGTYHNVAIYDGEGPEAAPVFNGRGIAGVRKQTYEFEAPEAGSYVFVCDFHPNMKGTLVVEPK